jgi:hypothetical protein
MSSTGQTENISANSWRREAVAAEAAAVAEAQAAGAVAADARRSPGAGGDAR